MLATLTDTPFDDPDWVFEPKWDGFRMIACIERRKVTLYSRNGKIISHNCREVAEALEKVKESNTVLDGELVALDQRGVSHFQLLQNALRAEAPLRYCLFDAMFAGGEDLRSLPLIERKKRLRRLLPKSRFLALSEHRLEYGTRYFKEAEDAGLEGIMAKRSASPYLSGVRTIDWLKIKTSRRAGSRYRRIYRPTPLTSLLRRIGTRRARRRALALCRSCRRRILSRGAEGALR